MPYVEQSKPETGGDRLFARLPAMGDDRAALIVWRGPTSYLVLNKYPYNAGHLLAAPYREVAQLAGLTPAERADLMDAIVKAQDILTRALQPDGFNVGFNFGRAAGAGLPTHLHAHIVPRWNGDGNFMPVLANTTVLPLALDTLWERLRQFAT
ncbi:MAG: HIT domain-containing protein [Opitutales bacterium]|jgi:ATP adenylyltransferase